MSHSPRRTNDLHSSSPCPTIGKENTDMKVEKSTYQEGKNQKGINHNLSISLYVNQHALFSEGYIVRLRLYGLKLYASTGLNRKRNIVRSVYLLSSTESFSQPDQTAPSLILLLRKGSTGTTSLAARPPSHENWHPREWTQCDGCSTYLPSRSQGYNWFEL